MTVNRYQSHLLILPEDDANRQVANGFCGRFGTRQIQVLQEARGWTSVCRIFEDDYIGYMRRYPGAYMVLVVDFDGQVGRIDEMRSHIPEDLAPRVFVLGALTEPERLRSAGLGHFEAIGDGMASDCPPVPAGLWSHPLLLHNLNEIARFRASACRALLA